MSNEPLPQFHFDENEYARPNQRWICGWAGAGRACPLGPTPRGRCRSAFECVPFRDGDTWCCARTKSQGGPCEQGPSPAGNCCRPIARCRPVRSLLAKRAVVSFAVFGLVLGIALIMVAAPQRSGVVSPGPLNPQHSTVIHDCSDCHAAGAGKLSDLVHAAFRSDELDQSRKCLECHRDFGDHPLAPHGQSADALAAVTRRIGGGRDPKSAEPLLLSAAKAGFGSPAGPHAELVCATCHREHHGASFDLTKLTSQQCQICHVDAFPDFQRGHPGFSAYPYVRRTRLYFDHLSHYGRHFPERPDSPHRRSCSECHAPDSAGEYMLVRGFEQSCAECHAEQIVADTTPSVLFAALPQLDLDALREKSAAPGQWPAAYPLHVQATDEVGPLMHWLLRSYDDFKKVEPVLAGIDLSDLSSASDEQIQAVEQFVWVYKQAVHDLLDGGQPWLRDRLSSVLPPETNKSQIDELVRQTPLELLLTAQERWLPDLTVEIQQRRAGGPVIEPATRAVDDPAESIARERRQERAMLSGWYLRDSDLSLRYRPAGHADVVLKTLYDFGTLSSPFATGRCLKCHTIDSDLAGGARINWFAARPARREHGFTRFKHAPHITLLDEAACVRCHELRTDEAEQTSLFRAEFISSEWRLVTDPLRFKSNFAHMNKVNCAQCHTSPAAGDGCTTCHNYHVR